jgi:hypothetical protein
MFMVMAAALGSAGLAGFDTGLDHSTHDIGVSSGTAHYDFHCGLTNICTVKTGTDTLTHIHWLCHACIGARCTQCGTEHCVTRGNYQCLIEIAANFGVSSNHFVNRHYRNLSPIIATETAQREPSH